MTSAGVQADPRPPRSLTGRRRARRVGAGQSDVTAGHSHLFLLSGARFLVVLARFNNNSLERRRLDRVLPQAAFHGIGVVIQP